MAVYAPRVAKTFFTYGGTTQTDRRHLLIMVSYYDHKLNRVPRPVIVMDKAGVDDPHDNAAINLDAKGYIWVFVSGRGRKRMGAKYRSRKPYDISAFERISDEEMTYPQPHYGAGKGFFHLFTKYTGSDGKGRQLYWETSSDGKTWSEDKALSLMPGHYQVSSEWRGKIGTFFNVHPGADVDRRTNVYYAQTADWGKTWTTASGQPLSVPLTEIDNAALVVDYQKQNRLMYTCDLNWDKDGKPLLLYVTGKKAAPGPDGEPRELVLTRWTGARWQTRKIADVDHNYDDGSLWVDGDMWTVIAPTKVGPQPWQGGGEMMLWTSRDGGESWKMTRQITRESRFNHNYARRPLRAKDPFFAFWADGDPTEFSKSQLYFCDSSGHAYGLPYDMRGAFATPVEVYGALQPRR